MIFTFKTTTVALLTGFLLAACSSSDQSSVPTATPSPSPSSSQASSSVLDLGGLQFTVPSFLVSPSGVQSVSRSFNGVRSDGYTIVYRYSGDFSKDSVLFYRDILDFMKKNAFSVDPSRGLKPDDSGSWIVFGYYPKTSKKYLASKYVQVVSSKGSSVVPPTVTFRVFSIVPT